MKISFLTSILKTVVTGFLVLTFLLPNLPARSEFIQASSFTPSDCSTYATGKIANLGNGKSCFSKYYYQNNKLYSRTELPASGTTTVRLYYNNTSDQSATNAYIQDSLPLDFNLVNNSVKNVYLGATVSLPDSLFTSRVLQVAPSAGFLGYANDASTGNLELGKKNYLVGQNCVYNNPIEFNKDKTSYTNLTGTANITQNTLNTANCPSIVDHDLSKLDTVYTNFFNTRYIRQASCIWRNSVTLDIYSSSHLMSGSNNNTPQGTDCQAGAIENGGIYELIQNQEIIIDTLNKKELLQESCIYQKTQANFTDQASLFDLIPSGGVDCTNANLSTYTNTTNNLSNINVADSTRGYGYIEYQMTANSGLANGSTFGTPVNFFSTETGPLSDDGFATLTISNVADTTSLACQSFSPANWEINNLNINDAELRTDQNFACNYEAKICVYVFLDANANNNIDSVDMLLSGINVRLSASGTGTTLAELTTTSYKDLNNNWIPICFTPLLAEKNYDLIILNPPTGLPINGLSAKNIAMGIGANTKNYYFGFDAGALSLTTDPNVTFSQLAVSSKPQDTCGTTYNIQVIDTRFSNPGWSVSATIEDFSLTGQSATKLLVSNKLTAQSRNLIIVENLGGGSQRVLGSPKLISSNSDPVTIMTANTSNGKGTTKSNLETCLTVPDFSKPGSYTSVITFTAF